MANEGSWIRDAFETATSPDMPALEPTDKIKTINALYNASMMADDKGTYTYGITRQQFDEAILSILRSQDHTPEFKRRIDNVVDSITTNEGHGINPVLSYLTYWDTLAKRDRKFFTEDAIDVMERSILREFDFMKKGLSISAKFTRLSGFWEEDYVQEMHIFKQPPVLIVPLDMRGKWEMSINQLKGGSLDDGFKLMKEVVEGGINIVQRQLSTRYMFSSFDPASQMPYQFYEDGENLQSLGQISIMPGSAIAQRIRETAFLHRFAHERSQTMENNLRDLAEQRREHLSPPELDKGMVARIKAMFGPKP